MHTTDTPRLTPREVGELVLAKLETNERDLGRILVPARIRSVTAVDASGLTEVEPDIGEENPQPDGIVWIVRADGTFVANRGRIDEPITSPSGYYLISDDTGAILGMGFP
ncbi:MAG: hypothetical protein ACRDHD_04500 [Candidatus Limnocylindria bacterium]